MSDCVCDCYDCMHYNHQSCKHNCKLDVFDMVREHKSFDAWWDKGAHGWGKEHLAEYNLAKAAWDAAILQAIQKAKLYEPDERHSDVTYVSDELMRLIA